MKFKEIKPGMVIHCPTEEDARALLEHLDGLGYVWGSSRDKLSEGVLWNVHKEGTCYVIHNYDKSIGICNLYGDGRPSCATPPTEFSDLIEPDDSPMAAKEVLEWLAKYRGKMESKECFGRMYDTDLLLNQFTAEEIIQKIEQYEAAKKAPKPAEVEYGYRCRICYSTKYEAFYMHNVTYEEAKQELMRKLKEYAIDMNVETFGDIVMTCHVKKN